MFDYLRAQASIPESSCHSFGCHHWQASQEYPYKSNVFFGRKLGIQKRDGGITILKVTSQKIFNFTNDGFSMQCDYEREVS